MKLIEVIYPNQFIWRHGLQLHPYFQPYPFPVIESMGKANLYKIVAVETAVLIVHKPVKKLLLPDFKSIWQVLQSLPLIPKMCVQTISFKFLFIPSNFLLLRGEFLKTCLKLSSVKSSQSCLVKFKTCGKGVNCISLFGLLKRFHGQTSWHISQPNIQLENWFLRWSGRRESFSSIVK